MNKYYAGEQLGNFHKKGKCKLTLIFVKGEWVINIYGFCSIIYLIT